MNVYEDKSLGKALLVGYIFLCMFLFYLLIDHPTEPDRSENILQKEYNSVLRYKYVINRKDPEFQRTPELENKIWMLWLQGEENAPDIVKASINSVRKHANGRDVIVLNEDTVKKYTQLPDYVWKKYREKKMFASHFCDMLRLDLLYRYGGTWIDSTVLLEDKIPDEILNSDVFMFRLIGSKTNLAKKKYHYLGNWFIHSQYNNRMIRLYRDILLEYWKYEEIQSTYLLSYSAVTCVINNDAECHSLYRKIPNYNERFLFHKYLDCYYDERLYDMLSKVFADGVPVLKMCHKAMPGHPPKGSIADYICRKYNVKCNHENGYR